MPWCEECSRYLTPNALRPDGSCPSCERVIAEPPSEPKAPWHFKLLVLGTVVYLGWRLVQGISWVVHHV